MQIMTSFTSTFRQAGRESASPRIRYPPSKRNINIAWVVPPPSNSGNEGLGWDSLLKMFHNPGGDWNPGRGDNPKYSYNNHHGCFQK